nr:unnamed protein product [Callosobruchus chinensis]
MGPYTQKFSTVALNNPWKFDPIVLKHPV